MSTIKITTLTDDNTCSFCKNALAKYSCPKCNQLYCTLKCYQDEQHISCSEQFYKDMVHEHLNSHLEDDQLKEQKMQEILKRFHEENMLADESEPDEENEELDSDDDDDNEGAVDDLGARLTGIDLDDSEQVWNNLTEAERKDFESFLQSGDVAQFVTMWTPWWEYKSPAVLNTEVWNKHKENCPEICSISRFSEISGKAPAKCVENNLINILAAYTFLQRYFNGEVDEFALEFSMFLWNLSLNLKENVNFDTAQMAIKSVSQQCVMCVDLGITTDKENQRHVKGDVNCLLAGPHSSERKFYMLSALSNVKSTFSKAKLAQQNTSKGEFYEQFTAQQSKALKTFTKENIKSATRKIDYYLSFVLDIYIKS